MSFPTTPTINQTYNGYRWNGELWEVYHEPEVGSVVQTIQFLRNGENVGTSLMSATTNSWSSFMSLPITLKYPDSAVLITAVFTTYGSGNGSSRLIKTVSGVDTQIDYVRYASFYQLTSHFEFTTYNHLHTPNTTSEIIFSVQGLAESGSVHFGYGDSGGSEHASLTLQEIKQ